MKKYFFASKGFYLILLIFLFSSCGEENPKNYSQSSLFDNRFKPSSSLNDLLKATDIECKGDLKCIMSETQKKWLRKGERWEILDDNNFDRKKLIPILERLNCVNEIKPLKKEYDYCLLLGAFLSSFEKRVQYLTDIAQKNNIHFKQLVFLGGKRKLSDVEKSSISEKFSYEKMPETEDEMMQLVYINSPLKRLSRNIKVIFIAADEKLVVGRVLRPNTEDTVQKWLQSHPGPGSILAISNQPYIGYQSSVLKNVLDKFTIEVAGPRASDDCKILIYLDSLARELYQEQKRLGL